MALAQFRRDRLVSFLFTCIMAIERRRIRDYLILSPPNVSQLFSLFVRTFIQSKIQVHPPSRTPIAFLAWNFLTAKHVEAARERSGNSQQSLQSVNKQHSFKFPSLLSSSSSSSWQNKTSFLSELHAHLGKLFALRPHHSLACNIVIRVRNLEVQKTDIVRTVDTWDTEILLIKERTGVGICREWSTVGNNSGAYN